MSALGSSSKKCCRRAVRGDCLTAAAVLFGVAVAVVVGVASRVTPLHAAIGPTCRSRVPGSRAAQNGIKKARSRCQGRPLSSQLLLEGVAETLHMGYCTNHEHRMPQMKRWRATPSNTPQPSEENCVHSWRHNVGCSFGLIVRDAPSGYRNLLRTQKKHFQL